MAGNNDISWDEIKALFAETNRKFQETDRLLTEKFQETDRKFQDTDRKLDKRFNELYGLFSSQWGHLAESLVEGDLVPILQRRGIEVEQTARRVKGSHEGLSYEFDIVARNGTEVVVVEVKTTLKPKHIQEFLTSWPPSKPGLRSTPPIPFMVP